MKPKAPPRLSASPQQATAIARAREASALLFIYEQGIATALQIGRHVLGVEFDPRPKYHLSLLRRLHRRGLVAFFNSPLAGERVYFLTSEGAAWLMNLWGSGDYWIPHLDFHSGRAASSIAHHLRVNDLRLTVEAAGYDFVSERIIRTAWGEVTPKIPDGLIGKVSDYPYWPGLVPIGLEYEHSPRSATRRLMMLSAGEKIIGQRVAGLLVVSQSGAIIVWRKSLAQSVGKPVFEVMGRAGKHRVHLKPDLLRFWTLATREQVIDGLETARIARRNEGQALWPWHRYLPWLGLRKAVHALQIGCFQPTPAAYTSAYPLV